LKRNNEGSVSIFFILLSLEVYDDPITKNGTYDAEAYSSPFPRSAGTDLSLVCGHGLRVKLSNDKNTRGISSLASDTSLSFHYFCLKSKSFGTMANSPPAAFPINTGDGPLVSTTAIKIILSSQL
jgi:hypothetical protein